MVPKNSKLYLVTGSPGGRTIINTVLCVMVNMLDYDMDVQVAVDAPRQHLQWFPDRLAIEDFKANDTAGVLRVLRMQNGTAESAANAERKLDFDRV